MRRRGDRILRAQRSAPDCLVGRSINTSKTAVAPKGFDFRINRSEHPDPAESCFGAGPLADRGTLDDAPLLYHLTPLCASGVWRPETAMPRDASDLRIERVMADDSRAVAIGTRPGVKARLRSPFGNCARKCAQNRSGADCRDRPVDSSWASWREFNLRPLSHPEENAAKRHPVSVPNR